MKMRKITSLTAALAFLLMVLTSIILYIVPQGRVAYWADWRLWGLSKTDWGNLHINLGFLFLIALSLHIYYNWKPLISYLKNKARQVKVITPDFNIALIVTMVVVVGTYFLIPPFNWVMTLNDYFKDRGIEKYGEPPYGHAELSAIKTFTKKMNLDFEKSLILLEAAGYAVENGDETLEAVGKKYKVPPQQIYEAIKPAAVSDARDNYTSGGGMPELPLPGTGNLTLADLCNQYGLNVRRVLHGLESKGVDASEELTLKEIAAGNKISPTDLYEAVKDISNQAHIRP
jgi:hypothetical protein